MGRLVARVSRLGEGIPLIFNYFAIMPGVYNHANYPFRILHFGALCRILSYPQQKVVVVDRDLVQIEKEGASKFVDPMVRFIA